MRKTAFVRWIRSTIPTLMARVRPTNSSTSSTTRPPLGLGELEHREPPVGMSITDFALFNDTGPRNNDRVTTDATLTGQLAGGAAAAGTTVQFDYNGDRVADFATTADGQGRFTVAPDQIVVGVNAVAARAISPEDGPGEWAVNTFVFVDSAGSQPQISSLGLAGGGGNVGSDPTVSGSLSGSGAAGATVEFDLTGDGTADATTTADANGNFSLTPADVPEGWVSLQARVAGGQGGWVSFNFLNSSSPNSPLAQAQAAALAALGGLGVGGSNALGTTSGAASNRIWQLTDAAQAAAAAAQQGTNAAISAAGAQFYNAQTAADALRFDAVAQANGALQAAGLTTETWFSFGAFAWPDAPNIDGAPVLSWDGPTPNVTPLSFEGAGAYTFVDGMNRLLLQGQEAVAYSGRWLLIQTALASATQAANTTYNDDSQNAYLLLQIELNNAQQDYERAAGSGSMGLTSLETLRLTAQQTYSNEVLAANTRYDTATATAATAYDAAVANADSAHTTAVNNAWSAYNSAEAAARAARDAEHQAAAQALQSELQAAYGSGSGSTPGSGSGSGPAYGSGSGATSGSGSGSGPSGPDQATIAAAYARYNARIQAANRAYTAAEAAAALLRDQTIADAAAVRTKARATAQDNRTKAAADATKNRATDLAAANAKLSGVQAVINADSKDIKFRAQVMLDRAKGQAKAKYDRKIADYAKAKALAVAAAQKTADVDLAVLEADHAKRLAQIELDTFLAPAGNDWAAYQRQLLVNEKARVDAVEPAGVTLATTSANRVYDTAVAAVNAAHQATYDSIAASLEELEAKIAAQEAYHAVANPKKKDYSLGIIGDIQYAADKWSAMERDYQRNHATAVTVKSTSDADHQATYAKEVAAAEAAYKNDQNYEARQAALNAAATKYFNATNATTIQLNGEAVNLDDTKKATGEDIQLAHELAAIGKGQALAELLAAELARAETNMAKAAALSMVKQAQAEGAVEVAKAAAEKAAVDGLVAAKQAYRGVEVSAEGTRDVANAAAKGTFEKGRATAYAAAMAAWAAAQGNTPWATYQSTLAAYTRDQTAALSNAAVALEEAKLTAKIAWVTGLSDAEKAHETARADARAQAASQQLGVLVSRAQQLGIAQVGLVTASGTARAAFDGANTRAQKAHDERAANAKKELKRKIRNADLVYNLAMINPVSWLVSQTLSNERRDKVAAAEKENAHTLIDAHKFLVIDQASARATYTKALADASVDAGTKVKAANQSAAGVAESIQTGLGNALSTADKAYTDALAAANKTRDHAVADAVKEIGVTAAGTKESFAGLKAAADRTFYAATAAAYQAAVAAWAGTQNTPAANYLKDLATAYVPWAAAIGAQRQALAAAVAAANKAAAVSRLTEAHGLATLKASEQESAEKAAAAAKDTAERVSTTETAALAKTAADADAEHQFGGLSAQAAYDRTVADAERDYDQTAAAAGAVYAKRIATARARKQTEPNWDGYDAELEAARKALYDPAAATSLTAAQRVRTAAVADAAVTWTEAVAAKDKAAVATTAAKRESASVQIAAARKTMVDAIAAAEKARRDAISDKDAAVEKADVVADQTSGTATTAAEAAHAEAVLAPSVELARATGTAEADYHIATADLAWQAAVARNAQFPSVANQTLAREAKLWRDWLAAAKPDFVTYQADNTTTNLTRIKTMVAAAGTRSTATLAAGKAYTDSSADAGATAGKAVTVAQTGATAAAEKLDAEHGAAAARAKTPWYNAQAGAQADHAVAKGRADRDYQVATSAAFAAWQAGDLTDAARAAYDAAITTANTARTTAVAAADAALAAARTAAEATYAAAVNAAGDAVLRGRAAEAKTLRVAIATAEKAETLAVAPAAAALDRAAADAELQFATASASADKAQVVELAGQDWDFRTAQATRAVPLVQQFATEDGTAFSAYRANRAQAEATWRTSQRAAYVAFITTTAAAQAAYNTAAATSDSARSHAIAASDEQVVTTYANVQYDLAVASANADEQLALRQIEIQAAARSGASWLTTTAQTVAAQVAWATSVAAAELAAGLNLATSDMTYRLAEVDAVHTANRAEVTAWAALEQANAATYSAYEVQAADSYAATLEATAVAHPSPWATRDAAVARADADWTVVMAAEWRLNATATITASRDKELGDLDRNRILETARAGLDWAVQVAKAWDAYRARLTTTSDQVLGSAPSVESPEMPGGRAASGPGTRASLNGTYVRYGVHGDGFYRGITGSMFQTYSWLDMNYYVSGISSWWAEGAAGPYGNPISEYIGEHIYRPLLGDYYLSTGDVTAIDWNNLWTLPGRWAAGAAGDLNQWLREMTFDPILREVFIAGLVVRGDIEEAVRQQNAFNLAIATESFYSPLAWFFSLTGAVGDLFYEFGGLDVRDSFDLGKAVREYGQGLSGGAYEDGKKAAAVLDVVTDIAIDVAIEVLTAGAATPVVAARRAAKAGVAAAEGAVKVGSKAARTAAKHVDDAAGAAKRAARLADDLPRARRALPGKTPHSVPGINPAAPVTGQLRRPEGMLGRFGGWMHDVVERGLSKVIHGWLGNTRLHDPLASVANRLGFKACFAAGTPLLTPDGSKRVEDFRAGDLILSRSEFDTAGPAGPRVVEEVFTREALIWHLHVGGQVIRTTAEHPFWVEGKGWLAVNQLAIGDRLVSHDGTVVLVEDLLDTGEWETVYNLRVGEDHTYFVGSEAWGFSVWAHNTVCSVFDKGRPGQHGLVNRLRNAIQNAVQQASNIMADSKLLDNLLKTGVFKKATIYKELLDYVANPATATQRAKNLVKHFGSVDTALSIFRGHAVQEISTHLLRQKKWIAQLIADKRLILDMGSVLGTTGSKGWVLRPDFQLRIAGNGRHAARWAIFDITTRKAGPKIFKYDEGGVTPFLVNIFHQ